MDKLNEYLKNCSSYFLAEKSATICFMKPGQTICTKQIGDLELLFRLPLESDAQAMMDYFNSISAEKTYITYQGEHIALEYEQEYLGNLAEKMEKNEKTIIQAWSDSELVGLLDIRGEERTDRHKVSLGITVKKEFRGLGIGKTLLKVALDFIKAEMPHVKIVWLTVFGNNQRAMHLYQQLGFKEFGRLPRGSTYREQYVDQFYMYLDVDSSNST